MYDSVIQEFDEFCNSFDAWGYVKGNTEVSQGAESCSWGDTYNCIHGWKLDGNSHRKDNQRMP